MKKIMFVAIMLLILAACEEAAPPIIEKVTPPPPEIEPPAYSPAEDIPLVKERIFKLDIRQTGITPETLTVNTGDTVRLHIYAMDYNHDFQLPAFGIYEKVNRDSPVTLEFIAGIPGEYDYKCMLNCAKAEGILTVK